MRQGDFDRYLSPPTFCRIVIVHLKGVHQTNRSNGHSRTVRNESSFWRKSEAQAGTEEGKDADFVIWSGDPFDTRNVVEATFVNGEKV